MLSFVLFTCWFQVLSLESLKVFRQIVTDQKASLHEIVIHQLLYQLFSICLNKTNVQAQNECHKIDCFVYSLHSQDYFWFSSSWKKLLVKVWCTQIHVFEHIRKIRKVFLKKSNRWIKRNHLVTKANTILLNSSSLRCLIIAVIL